MKLSQFREKVRDLIKQVYQEKIKTDDSALAYDELTKFPELKNVIVDLLTVQFDKFIESIDWVSPRPTTFRINLLNNQFFFLIFTERSWIAQVEGKKYYLLNVDEEERAAEAISRILQYGAKVEKEDPFSETEEKPEKSSKEEEPPTETEENPEIPEL